MKNLIYILVLIVVLSSCSRKSDIELKDEIHSEMEITETNVYDAQKTDIKMYVNSPEGLRVRNSPGIGGDRIGLLDDLTEVLVIKEDENNINIDGIDGKWTFIAADNIQGWVFDGYLTLEPQHIRLTVIETINGIAEYISNDLNLYNSYRFDGNSLQEYLAVFNITGGYNILEKNTFENRFKEIQDIYVIEYGYNRLEISVVPRLRKYLLDSLDIKINRENYLLLFPYRTMAEFMAADNFGELYNPRLIISLGDEYIHYNVKEEIWALRFTKSGLLYEIAYRPYKP
jgi:hypothetical protein